MELFCAICSSRCDCVSAAVSRGTACTSSPLRSNAASSFRNPPSTLCTGRCSGCLEHGCSVFIAIQEYSVCLLQRLCQGTRNTDMCACFCCGPYAVQPPPLFCAILARTGDRALARPAKQMYTNTVSCSRTSTVIGVGVIYWFLDGMLRTSKMSRKAVLLFAGMCTECCNKNAQSISGALQELK